MADKLSIAECRRILGNSANGMTDAAIEAMRDDLERTANVLYDQIREAANANLDAVRWLAHFQQTGEGE